MASRTTTTAIQRTTIDLDIRELEKAKRALGTKTKRETVNRALKEVNRMAALRRAADLVRAGGLNIVRPEDLPELRKPRADAK
ncbi:MAG: type II toxin-antitoxin system VapB family antitoxin [Gaiellaceae bacterium]